MAAVSGYLDALGYAYCAGCYGRRPLPSEAVEEVHVGHCNRCGMDLSGQEEGE